MRHRLLLAASAVYLISSDLIWISRDSRPPFWDMAGHLTASLGIHDAFRSGSAPAALESIFAGVTGYYPPLAQSAMALSYGVFGETIDAALWANVPAVLVLLIATYGIGRTVLSPLAAASAAVMVNFYPLMLWLSREAMMDYWLASLVTLTMWTLVSGKLENWKGAASFGFVAGLGMLTKWTFPLFIAFPFLWFARNNVRNAAIGAGLAAVLAVPWYATQIPTLMELLQVNTSDGIGEGDPRRLSLAAAVFYVRALAGYQVFFPLFVAFLAGVLLLARRFNPAWMPILLWVAGGWVGLMLFLNKDPRYSIPILPAVALITAKVFEHRRGWVVLLLPFLLFQHYLVSFGIGRLPEKIVLMEGVSGPLSYDWNLYTQTYFGLWGPPARQDWKLEHVLDTVVASGAEPIQIGIVPDIPRFDPRAFQLYVAIRKDPVTINRLWVFDEAAILGNDYILTTDGSYGAPGSFLYSPDRQRIAEYLDERPDIFRVVDSFVIPSGETIRLYRALP